jgi:GTP-binding protein
LRVTATFLTSAAGADGFPAPGPPEVAFLGRSNVGKSSLLNSLVGAKVAKVSSTPGRTRTINFFALGEGRHAPEMLFADLPGYGYAKLPRALTAEWPKFIEPYLQERSTLALCVVLVDPNVPTQESDRKMVEWLQAQGRELLLVATKADRLSGNRLRSALARLRRDLGAEKVLPYSARTGAGRDELWREIRRTVVSPERWSNG